MAAETHLTVNIVVHCSVQIQDKLQEPKMCCIKIIQVSQSLLYICIKFIHQFSRLRSGDNQLCHILEATPHTFWRLPALGVVYGDNVTCTVHVILYNLLLFVRTITINLFYTK